MKGEREMALVVTLFPLVLGATIVILALLKKMKKLRTETVPEDDKNENLEVKSNVQGDRD